MIYLKNSDIYIQELFKQAGLPFSSDIRENIIIYIESTPDQLIMKLDRDKKLNVRGDWLKVDFIAPDKSELFRNIGIVDIGVPCLVPENANLGNANGKKRPIIYSGENEIIIPFGISKLLQHRGSTIKQFFGVSPRLPTERVAIADRGGIRRIIASSVRSLLNKNNLPYVYLSYSPGFSYSFFGFRVDTDFSSISTIAKAMKLAEKLNMRWTWFVNTGISHYKLKELIDILSGQDIQLHCYNHLIYNNFEKNVRNFFIGKELLEKSGIQPIGVAAPYGYWSEILQRSFEELKFKYSSEFCYSYDDLPSRPIILGRLSSVLQIPVHPISMGRLVWAKASKKEIVDYYRRVIDLQVARMEPCFLYDHPDWITRYPEIFEEILEYAIERCGCWGTLSDYYRWWQIREDIDYNVSVEDNTLKVEVNKGGEGINLIVGYENSAAIIPLKSGKYELNSLPWKVPPPVVHFSPKELQTKKIGWQVKVIELIREMRNRQKSNKLKI